MLFRSASLEWVAPVPQRVEVAHEQTSLDPLTDIGKTASNLAGDKGLTTARALVIEEYPVAGVEAVGLAVVDRNPVGVELGNCLGRPRIKRRRLGLRCFLYQPVELRGRGLVEAGFLLQPKKAYGFE